MIIWEGIVPAENPWHHGLEPRIFNQVEHIVGKFAEQTDSRPRAEIGGVRAGGGVGFMHAERQLLVRAEYRDQVVGILQRSDLGRASVSPSNDEPVTRGVRLLSFDESLDRPPGWVLSLVDEIDAELGRGIVTPHHVLTVAPEMGPCPATEPREVEYGIEPYPGVCRENSGAGVLIYIADTGVLKGAENSHSWLQGVTSDRASHPWLTEVKSEEDTLPPPAQRDGEEVQPIDPYDGHGTFVAGVARCMAPEADIIVDNVFRTAGSALEKDFIQALDRALRLGVNIFHLSVVAPTRNDIALLSLESWLERLGDYKGIVCVVPAGNSGTQRPCWPAASPRTISVGALAADWRTRADFSNYGGWVDVYAPGRDLINAYASGIYTCKDAPYTGEEREFYGMARWSGTSFSSPLVTGLIAARMSRCGENAQQAAAALLAEARSQAIPGVGPVLLPPGDVRR
jgi:hypothetical protein